jgi:cation transport regulator ChaC
MTYYFAYGSNLNNAHWQQYLTARGYEANALAEGTVTQLCGWRLVFNHHSNGWGGLVANIMEAEGSFVPGVVFNVDSHTLQILDRKEGAPHVYQRRWVEVEINCKMTRVITYVVPPRPGGAPDAPAPAYLQVVSDGYQIHGLDIDHLNAAAGNFRHQAGDLVDRPRKLAGC